MLCELLKNIYVLLATIFAFSVLYYFKSIRKSTFFFDCQTSVEKKGTKFALNIVN